MPYIRSLPSTVQVMDSVQEIHLQRIATFCKIREFFFPNILPKGRRIDEKLG